MCLLLVRSNKQFFSNFRLFANIVWFKLLIWATESQWFFNPFFGVTIITNFIHSSNRKIRTTYYNTHDLGDNWTQIWDQEWWWVHFWIDKFAIDFFLNVLALEYLFHSIWLEPCVNVSSMSSFSLRLTFYISRLPDDGQ